MNVLLVPAHPGFPGQIPQSRKTVVVVVVVVVVSIMRLSTRHMSVQLSLGTRVSRLLTCRFLTMIGQNSDHVL